jgi:hypothetical protein
VGWARDASGAQRTGILDPTSLVFDIQPFAAVARITELRDLCAAPVLRLCTGPGTLMIDGCSVGMSCFVRALSPRSCACVRTPLGERPGGGVCISQGSELSVGAQRSSSLYADSTMRRRYYGQNGEDAILWLLFHKPHGFHTGVGASDGTYLSSPAQHQ